jgi:hypothetical protein
MFTVTVRTADPGEAGARIATVEIALDDLLDDRPEMTVLLLKAGLVGCQEPVEAMERTMSVIVVNACITSVSAIP